MCQIFLHNKLLLKIHNSKENIQIENGENYRDINNNFINKNSKGKIQIQITFLGEFLYFLKPNNSYEIIPKTKFINLETNKSKYHIMDQVDHKNGLVSYNIKIPMSLIEYKTENNINHMVFEEK